MNVGPCPPPGPALTIAPGARTLIMGVLNVTPDSFSDGGELPTTSAVIDRAGTMLAEGVNPHLKDRP